MKKKTYETVECECGNECPVEFSTIDENGCWTCANCLINFINQANDVTDTHEPCALGLVSERFSLIDKKDPKFEILFREDGSWFAYDYQLTDMMRELVIRYNKMAECLNAR